MLRQCLVLLIVAGSIFIAENAAANNSAKTASTRARAPAASNKKQVVAGPTDGPRFPWSNAWLKARDYQSKGNYDAAVNACESIIRQIEKDDREALELLYPLVTLSQSYEELGRLKDAEEVARRAVRIAETTPLHTKGLVAIGLKQPQLNARCLDLRAAASALLGEFLTRQQRYTEARPCFERQAALNRGTDLQLAPLLELADLACDESDYDRAEALFKQVIGLAKRDVSKHCMHLASALAGLGECYFYREDYRNAESANLESLRVLRKTNHTDDELFSTLHSNLGDIYKRQGRLLEAELAFRTSLDCFLKRNVAESELVRPWQDIAGVLVASGRLAEAEHLYNLAFGAMKDKGQTARNLFLDTAFFAQSTTAKIVFANKFPGVDDLGKVLTAQRARMDPNSIQYAQFLEDAAFAYPFFRIKTQPVIPLLAEAIRIRERLEGKDSPYVADDKFRIALRLAVLGGDFKTVALEAYDIWRRLGEKSQDYYVQIKLKSFQPSILRLAYLLASEPETRPKAIELANISMANFRSTDPTIGRELEGIGKLFEAMGEYGPARTAYEAGCQHCADRREVVVKARLTTSVGRVSYLEGDFDVGWEKAKAAEEMYKQIWGAEYYRKDPDGMSCLELLTAMARSKGDLPMAEGYARNLVVPVSWAPKKYQFASRQLELIQIQITLKKYSEAKISAKQIIDDLSNLSAKSYLDEVQLAKAHAALGGIALAEKNYQLAELEYRQASNYHERDESTLGLLGRVADGNGIALASLKRGARKAASESVLRSCKLLDAFIQSAFKKLSFSEQCVFISCVNEEFSPLLSMGLGNGLDHECFRYVMRWQGMLIEAVRHRTVLERGSDPKLVARLKELRNELSRLTGENRKSISASSILFEKRVMEEKEGLERRLAAASRSHTASDPFGKFTATDFSKTLADDEVFIDVVHYKNLLTLKPAYVGFLVSSKSCKTLSFGDADDIDKSAGRWLNAMATCKGTTRDSIIEKDSDAALSDEVIVDNLESVVMEKLWKPITSALPEGVRKVWICPDAQLSKLPWSVFIDRNEPGRLLVSQVDSPRILLQLKAPYAALPTPNLLLVGGINFANGVPFLPGTVAEVQTIQELADSSGVKLDKMTGNEPTKDKLLSAFQKANYAHLATHGFFDAVDDKEKSNEHGTTENALIGHLRSFVRVATVDSDIDTSVMVAARNPLLTSGLLVAPIEESTALLRARVNWLKPLSGSRDDRLTAEELVGKDLSRCNLVVLSACNTGRGKSYEGQGVMGLRAALTGAGARGVLLSLWPVDDNATSALMTHFYRNLWSKTRPMKPAEALRTAQNTVKSTEGGKWKHPFYWAGWVFDGSGW